MAKIARLNRMPAEEKNRIYLLLIPPSLFSRLRIDPETLCNPEGEFCITIEAPEGGAEASISVVREKRDRDPAFYLEISDSRDLIQLSWDFIVINDPDTPRFNTDLTPDGGDRWLNWRNRNRTEELMALSFGLSPGQVRKGMRLTGELNQCLDRFCLAVGFESIALEALYYHNALIYERHGFRYFQGEPMMRRIHQEFQPGGRLWKRLDGSSAFRNPDHAQTIRGRSWAIHDGVLEEAEMEDETWSPPKMYRMVGKRFSVNTAPGVRY